MWNKLKFSLHWRVRVLSERLNILLGHKYVLVYTMGKVGSTSLYYSLKKVLGPRAIFIHRMNIAAIHAFNVPFLRQGIKPHGYALALFVKSRIIDKKKPVSIVSAVREPIARNISDFFQDFKVYNGGKDFTQVSIEECTENFINNYPHHLPAEWFQMEFSEILGINLHDIAFDKAKKYGNVHHGNCRILLFRTDLEDDAKTQILRQFLSKPNINLRVKNAHHQKAYSDYYTSFQKHISLPPSLVEKVYSEKYLTFFYTKEELEVLRAKWMAFL